MALLQLAHLRFDLRNIRRNLCQAHVAHEQHHHQARQHRRAGQNQRGELCRRTGDALPSGGRHRLPALGLHATGIIQCALSGKGIQIVCQGTVRISISAPIIALCHGFRFLSFVILSISKK